MDRIEKLKLFLKDNPGDSFLKHALAMEYIKAGDDVMAENLLNQILSATPDYVGSYYQLGKLLERRGNNTAAIEVYIKGMELARAGGDNHTWNELRAAHEELVF
ncbi:MAG: tetratricopeptide repeat protein [Niabella sp.]